MKFMVSWSIDQENWLPILKKWAGMTPEERADAGEGVKMIGRWHDTASRCGMGIFEATDLIALNRYPWAVESGDGHGGRTGAR